MELTRTRHAYTRQDLASVEVWQWQTPAVQVSCDTSRACAAGERSSGPTFGSAFQMQLLSL